MTENFERLPLDVRSQSIILFESGEFLIGIPQSPLAMFWWGAFTDWCTARDSACFNDYAERGALIVFQSRTTSMRWLLHPTSGEFRDAHNRRSSSNGFLMRNKRAACGILSALAAIASESRPSLHNS